MLLLSDDIICEELRPENVDGWMDAISSRNSVDDSPANLVNRLKEANDFLADAGEAIRVIYSRCDGSALQWVLAPVISIKK